MHHLTTHRTDLKSIRLAGIKMNHQTRVHVIQMPTLAAVFAVICVCAFAKADQKTIYLEDSPAAQDLLARARQMHAQGRLADAARTCQRVIVEYPHKIMATQPRLYTDARRVILDWIKSDRLLLEAYRRLHDAQAQRALAQARSIHDLEQVVARYQLCGAGFSASLRLTAGWLAIANPVDAGHVLVALSEHPDLADHRVQYHLLAAATSLYLNDDATASHHRAQLDALGDVESSASLARWSKQFKPPLVSQAYDGFSRLPRTTVPDPPGRPLWQVKMPSRSGVRQVQKRNVGQQQRIRQVGQSQGLPLYPVVHEDRVFVNARGAVLALDRASGRVVWSYYPSKVKKGSGARRRTVNVGNTRQYRSIAVAHDRVLAVIGVAPNRQNAFIRRTPGSSLVCLSLREGRPLWQKYAGQLDPSLKSAWFVGTPLIGYRDAYVVMSRPQVSGFQDTFVAAVDVMTGELSWRRHLSSAVRGRFYNAVRPPRMILDGPRLFVTDQIGVIACLDRRSGSVLWLRVDAPEAINPNQSRPRRNQGKLTASSAPVRVPMGLIVPSYGGSDPALLLDPLTGKRLDELSGDVWRSSQLLMSVGTDVLSVGKTVTRLNGVNLTSRWQRAIGQLGATSRVGYPAVTQDRLLLPIPKGILVIDLKTGDTLSNLAVKNTGNVLLVEGQMLVSTPEAVSSFMAWQQVQSHLNRQIVDQPLDPRPALALAHIARSSGRTDQMLDAIDHVLKAVERRAAEMQSGRDAMQIEQDLREHDWFRELLRFIDPAHNRDRFLRQMLFDRIATVTFAPRDEVAFQLALGDFLTETKQYDRAAEHYQAVLEDPSLAIQHYRHESGMRQAGLEAQLRLSRLLEQAGRRLAYRRYESLAAEQLVALEMADNVDAQAYLQLVHRYPLSRTATTALMAAAKAKAQSGDTAAAISYLGRAYARARQATLLQRIVGAKVQLYERRREFRMATQTLLRVKREYPDLQPLRNGRPMPVSQWLDDLAQHKRSGPRRARLTLPLSQPTVIAGRLLAPKAQPRRHWLDDQIITMHQGTATLRRGPLLEPVWSVPVRDDRVYLLWMDRDQVGLWLRSAGQLLVLDASTGKPSFPASDLTVLFEQPAIVADNQEEDLEANDPVFKQLEVPRINLNLLRRGVEIDPQIVAPAMPTVLFQVSDTLLFAADVNGQVLAIERHSGRVLWRVAYNELYLAGMVYRDDVLVINAVEGYGMNTETGILIWLDPNTGQRVRQIEETTPIGWVGFGGDGLLLHTSEKRLIGHHLNDGSVAWRLRVPDKIAQGVGYADYDLMFTTSGVPEPQRDPLVAKRSSLIVVVDAIKGQLRGRISTGHGILTQLVDAQPVANRWHLLTTWHAWAISSEGQVVWRDAINATRKHLLLQRITNNHVFVLGRDSDTLLPGLPVAHAEAQNQVGEPISNFIYRLYVLDRNSGTLVNERVLGPMPQRILLSLATLLNDRLVLSTKSSTIVLSAEGKE